MALATGVAVVHRNFVTRTPRLAIVIATNTGRDRRVDAPGKIGIGRGDQHSLARHNDVRIKIVTSGSGNQAERCGPNSASAGKSTHDRVPPGSPDQQQPSVLQPRHAGKRHALHTGGDSESLSPAGSAANGTVGQTTAKLASRTTVRIPDNPIACLPRFIMFGGEVQKTL